MGLFGKPKGEEVRLKVEGMTCGNCVHHVTKALEGLKGVNKVDVSLRKKEALVYIEPGSLKRDDLKKAVVEAGYKAD